MISIYNFDRKISDNPLSSGCMQECVSHGCNPYLNFNDQCDSECNIKACGFDAGKCATC